MSSTSPAWTCPRCDRLVPFHVDLCRCGAPRAGPSGANGTDAADTAAPTTTLTPAGWALLLPLLLLAAAATAYLWPSRTPPPPTTPLIVAGPAPASAAPAPPAPAVEASAAPPSVSAVPEETSRGPDSPSVAPVSPFPAADTRSSIEDVVARATSAVVMVETSDSRGTGFFVSPDTLITNDHVVGRAASVTVRLHDGSTRTARVERTAPEVDLAVLRVSGMSTPPQVLALKSADQVRPGQEVFAIGSALGLQSTVTRGIVSARRLAGAVLLLQTDAAINRGNSGGPLLDRDGAVVGVTTLKMGSGAEGLGFAVAADHVRALLDGRAATTVPSASSGSPQAPLAPGVPAFTNDTSADGQRTRGQETYARELARLAQQAAQIDTQWARFDRTCAPRVARDGDRPWFSIAGRDTAFASRDGNCPYWLSDMQRMSQDFAGAMQQTNEAARRAGVYPGTLRDLRRQLRLDWSGFER